MAQSQTHVGPDLFTPVEVGPLHLKNRVVMAPLTRSRAAKGNVPTAINALYYAQRANTGLIISEATQVSQQGQGYIATSWGSYRRSARRCGPLWLLRHQGFGGYFDLRFPLGLLAACWVDVLQRPGGRMPSHWPPDCRGQTDRSR